MESGSPRRITLLGPVACVRNGHEVELRGPAQRTLLAVLAVYRGQSVSVDRIIDELWPTEPPQHAAKTLQVYVSRLRTAVGADAIGHSSGGYALRPDAATVDVDEFERRYDAGRRLRASGDGRSAGAELRAAMSLWRGSAIGGITDGALSAEIERLESLRLAVLEERIEADLDLGRNAPLVAELERLVREHPFRETLRMQLMRALYASGRQADALATYREGRDRLRHELGLEPRPELVRLQRAILNHDSGLQRQAPMPRLAATIPAPRSGRRWPAVGVVVVAAIGFVVAPLDPTPRPRVAVAPDSLVRIDPRTNAIVAQLPTGGAPVAVTTGGGSVWVADASDRTLTRVDPERGQIVGRTGLGRIPSRIVYSDGGLWVASAAGADGVVQRIDAATGTIVSSATVRTGGGIGDELYAPPTPSALAVDRGRVWANSLGSTLSRVDPSRSIVATRTVAAGHSVDGIAAGLGALWIASGSDDRVLRLDAAGGHLVAEIPIASTRTARLASPYGITVAYGVVWVTNALSNTVSAIDPHLNAVVATIRVGDHPSRITAADGAIWVVNAGDRSVSRIDPVRRLVEATIAIGADITDIAAGLQAVWVTVGGGHAPGPGGHQRDVMRPLAGCTTVAGSAHPQLLIASELPTFLGESTAAPVTADMRSAILAVLRDHGFRAGRYRIGYQQCDDSRRGGGPAPERCAANARAYSLDPSLVGVIGPLDSGCAEVGLPTLNAAPGGPVAMVSPSNTYVGLTHPGPATAADEPERYHPNGERSYVHLLAADDVQGTAIAIYLAQAGRKRVYLLDDGGATGFAGATYAGNALAKLRVAVAGRSTWDDGASGYRALAERVAAAHADAVVLSGCVCSNGVRLLTDLRATLGPALPVVATDNFTANGDDFRTTFSRLGLHVAIAGLDGTELPVSGRSLFDEVAKESGLDGAGELDPLAAYAGAATSVLLSAIARSDGTRASVVRALFARPTGTSAVGPIGFEPDGDPVAAPITIYRVDAAVGYRSRRACQGLVAERTFRPPTWLTG